MARVLSSVSAQYLRHIAFAAGAFPLTVSAWFQTASVSTGAYQRVFTWQDSGSNAIASAIINYPAAGDIANQVYKGATNALPSKSGVTANTWHHVAAVSLATSNTIYLDGVQGGTATYTDPVFSGMTYMWVGATAGPTQYLNGRLAFLAVHSVALTGDEIAAIGDKLNGVPCGVHPASVRPDALVACWDFGGFAGDDDRDQVGGYDLTATNVPTFGESPAVAYPQAGLITDSGELAGGGGGGVSGMVSRVMQAHGLVLGA